MILQELLVVVAHSGILIPGEIPLQSLSGRFSELASNIDWYTNWLYDFRDILNNRHIVFPYCSLILEGNRHPDILDDSVPLKDVNGEPVYREGREPDVKLRRKLVRKYLKNFHKAIEDDIVGGADFLIDGHSTVTARGVADNQIELMSYQHSYLDEKPRYYCPLVYVETYAEELQRRLPEVKVTINSSQYSTVYGHVCAKHSVAAMGRLGKRVPAFIQETNEHLFKNPDGTPDIEAIDRLRRAFAGAIYATYKHVKADL